MPTDSLLLLRTHYVDDTVFALATKLSREASLDLAFVVDETRGPIDTRGLAKVSLTHEQLDRAGLYRAFDRPAWRCGDYGFYLAQREHPGYAHYWMIEQDVRLNFASQGDFFSRFAACQQVDLLASHFAESPPDWFWYRSMQPHYRRVYRCLFSMIRLSQEAITFLKDRRLALAAALPPESEQTENLWPNDESFVATELANNGFVCQDLNGPGRTVYTRGSVSVFNLIAQSDFARRRLDGLVYHPVLYGPHYAKKLLVLTAASGDVGAARRQIARLTGHEWTERQAEEYQRELDQIPPVRSSLAQRLRRRLSPFVTRMRDAVDAARRR